MPVTNVSFIRWTAILLGLGFLALIAIVGTTVWLVDRTQVYSDVVVQSRVARVQAVDILGRLRDAETAQRGYLLTQDESYLEPYNQGLDGFDETMDRLGQALSDYPGALAGFQAFRQTAEAKLSELAETIDLARQGNLIQALEIVRSDRGKQLMDEAQAYIDNLVTEVDDRVAVGRSEQNASMTALRWVSIIGAIMLIGVVGGSSWMAIIYTRELQASQEEVKALNLGLEERVQERTRDLGRANEEIQRFAYIVTHDLRAPLVNIMGFTSELEASLESLKAYVLHTDGPVDERIVEEARIAAAQDVPEAIGFIRSSTRKMDGLINAILKISREGRRTLQPERVDLQKIIDQAAAAVHHQVTEDGGGISIDIRAPIIISDRLSLEQVFGNLLDNAVKYRDPSRPLALKVSAHEASGNRIQIDVKDNGRGIAEQDHERVFELFRRSGSQNQAGEGIGLAHVRTVVRNLGGDITLTSGLGQGTTFHISLPRDLRAFVRSSQK